MADSRAAAVFDSEGRWHLYPGGNAFAVLDGVLTVFRGSAVEALFAPGQWSYAEYRAALADQPGERKVMVEVTAA